MCGIAGFQGRSPQRGQQLVDALGRRGPDGSWAVEHGELTLVQTRLAVIDLSERVQYPMLSPAGDVALLFNGEIYGFDAVRRELEALGHVFRTACDAEVVLHGYLAWGDDVLRRVDGMFAVAISDRRDGSLLLARDALGIKPLVYTTGPGPLGFSSDAISLVSAGFSHGELDTEALEAHLALHYMPAPATGVRDIAQLPAGFQLRLAASGERVLTRWAADPMAPPAPRALISAGEIRDAVQTSVARQSIADVPVGVFLSGGIDSALILAAAVHAGHQPVAFTLGFSDAGDYDELPLAMQTAQALGVPHRHERLTGGFAETVDAVAGAFDLPFADSSAIAAVQLARLARQDVTVALSGTGGDELFGGYDRYRAHRLLRPLRLLPPPVRRALVGLDPPRGSERTTRSAVLRSRVARLAALDPADPIRQYLGLVANMSSPAAVAATSLVAAPPASMSAGLQPGDSVLRALCRLDLATYLPGDVLAKEDRASMAVGLEARVPLLGAGLVELSGRMPDSQKIRRSQGKVALRALAREINPSGRTAGAPKRGFAVPLGPLLAGRWRAEARELLAAASGVVDGPRAVAALERGDLTPADVWTLANLAAWEARVDVARRSARSLVGGPVAG